MAWLVSSLRRLRDERIPALGLVALVLVTALVFALAPRLFERVADGALRSEVDGATSATRDLRLDRVGRIEAGAADPLSEVDAVGADLGSQLPAAVRSILADRVAVIDTPYWRIGAGVQTPSVVTLRIQEGVESRIRLVGGRLPTGATRTIPDPSPDARPGDALVVLEAAMSDAAAAAMGVPPGGRLLMSPDQSDVLAVGRSTRLAVDIVGTYRVTDPADDYWIDDAPVEGPTIRALTSEVQFTNATLLLAPAAYPALLGATEVEGISLRYGWRYRVDPAALQAGRLDDLIVGLRRAGGLFDADATMVMAGRGTALRSGLLPLLAGYQARWTSAAAVLTAVSIGPLAVAIATLGLVALLASIRRRRALALCRGRGASSVQTLASALLEGSLLAGPPAGAAAAIAIAVVPAGAPLTTVLAAVAVAAVALGLLVAVIVPTAFGPPRAPARDPGVVGRAAPRRLVAEALVVALALGGAVLLRERGVGGLASASSLVPADPFIAAVPALVGVAAGVLAVRLFPMVMRGLVRAAARLPGLVPVLALRRASRGGSAASVLLILMATATIGAFSSATLVQLDRAADAVAWQDVGAAFRLVSPTGAFRADFDPARLPGVAAAAGGYSAPVTLSTGGVRQLLAIDMAGYREVSRGTPVEPAIPAEMLVPTDQPLPAIVSVASAGGPDALEVGDTFDLALGGERVRLRVVDVRATFPSLPVTDPFVVVDRGQLRAALPGIELPSTTALLRAADDAASTLRAAVEATAPATTVVGRTDRAASIRGAPVVEAVTIGVGAAAAIAIAYAALAVAAALALAGAARAIEVAHLSTLGLARRQALALVALEYGPTSVVAFLAGAGLGLGLFVFLLPGLGLSAVVGSPVEVPTVVEASHLALLLLAIGAIVALGVALGAALQRTATPAMAIRQGIE